MSQFQIEKLDEHNYDMWSLQMKSVLVHGGFWRTASGESTVVAASSAEEKARWRETDEKALATIVLSVKGTNLNAIKNCKTSHEAWTSLETIHKPKGPLQKVSLYKRLLNLNMQPGGKVSKHVDEFVDLADKLEEIGLKVQDELLVIMLLSSLPPEFDHLVVAMETRDSLPNLSTVRQKILDEGMRRIENGERDEDDAQKAFAMQSKKEKARDAKPNTVEFKGKCFKCGVAGHYARNCKKKGKKQEKSQLLNAVATGTLASQSKFNWCFDSGATAHMCCERELFTTFDEHCESISLAGDQQIVARGKGDVQINYNNLQITFQNVLYSPDLHMNFVSISRVVEKGLTVVFDNRVAQIKRGDGSVVMSAQKHKNLYLANCNMERLYIIDNSLQLWHSRFGHLNVKSLQEMSKKSLVQGLPVNNAAKRTQCRTCMLSKVHVAPFPKEATNRATSCLELVHSDVCGPFRINSLGGSRYFVTFIDDYTRRVFVYFIKSKSEVFQCFKKFKQHVEKQTGRFVKALRSDNGREYVNKEFNDFLEKEGIARQLTVAYTPQQNGVAERSNRTLVEMARSMMVESGVSQSLWAEAVNTASYIRNRCTTKTCGDKTPYEMWFGRTPNVQHLRVFGSTAVALNKAGTGKFDAKGETLVMVGYSQVAKAYRLYDPKKHRITERRDVLFDECIFNRQIAGETDDDFLLFNPSVENGTPEIVGNGTPDTVQTQQIVEIPFERNNTDVEEEYLSTGSDFEGFDEISSGTGDDSDGQENPATTSNRGRPRIIRTGQRGRPSIQRNALNLMEETLPQSVEDVMASSNSKKWLAAMQAEMTSLQQNGTWSLVDLPPGRKVVSSKWVFAVKKDEHGEIDRYKARLVARGCSQRFGVDYDETFSPVLRYSTIRIILALAVQWRMHLHQIDISSAYLNSEIQHEIYMRQPEMFVDTQNPKKVLKLHKAIYGLKQSGMEWYAKLTSVLEEIGFSQSENEPCLYKATMDNSLVLVAVYVDDLLIGSADESKVIDVKQKLATKFPVTDKGQLHHYLGIQVEREGETGSIQICQSQYIQQVLHEYGMENCKAASTPLDANFQVVCTNEGCEEINQHDYKSLIGALMYLAITSRPDILHSVSKLAQRNCNPHKEHMQALKHILRYLRGTINMKLIYTAGKCSVEGYVDADWAGDALDRKSYTGFVFFVNNCPVSWESKKQSCVALSSTEAEYMAMSESAKEAIFLRRLLRELNYITNEPLTLNIDNQGAQKLASYPVYHKRTKHIDIRFHHVREVVKNKEITLQYCPTEHMVADVLTKNLSKNKHNYFRNIMKCI